jgi:hypothetical protein
VKATTDPHTYPTGTQTSITVFALKENKRPVGFAPWPKEKKPKKKAS